MYLHMTMGTFSTYYIKQNRFYLSINNNNEKANGQTDPIAAADMTEAPSATAPKR